MAALGQTGSQLPTLASLKKFPELHSPPSFRDALFVFASKLAVQRDAQLGRPSFIADASFEKPANGLVEEMAVD